MAAEERGGHAARASPGAWPGGAQPAGPPSGPRGCGAPRRGPQTPAAAEKRGPYRMARVPSVPAKLQKHRDLATAALRRKGLLGASPKRPDPSGKSDGELESRYSSGYSSAEQVNQDVSRQLLQDGYHLDEIPDDEDLDLIPPKPMASTCSCCWCCPGDSFSCTLQ